MSRDRAWRRTRKEEVKWNTAKWLWPREMKEWGQECSPHINLTAQVPDADYTFEEVLGKRAKTPKMQCACCKPPKSRNMRAAEKAAWKKEEW